VFSFFRFLDNVALYGTGVFEPTIKITALHSPLVNYLSKRNRGAESTLDFKRFAFFSLLARPEPQQTLS
jgi:hypothetical protein